MMWIIKRHDFRRATIAGLFLAGMPKANSSSIASDRTSMLPRFVSIIPRWFNNEVVRIAVSTVTPASSASVARLCRISEPNFR